MEIISFFIGYIFGSFPSAYLIGKIFKNIDMRKVGNGRIGASFSSKVMGLKFGIIVGILDFLKGFLPLVFLSSIGFNKFSLIFSSIGEITGHNWSIFMGFKGGLGALVMYGVLFYFFPLEFLIIFSFTGIFYFLIRNTYYSTFFLVSGISLTSIFTKKDFFLFVLPLFLFLIMTFKLKSIKKEANA